MARDLRMQHFTLASRRQPDETVVKEILNYFIRNPQAADSLEGIARWRLLDEIVRRNLEETERALQWLVAQRFLNKEVVTGRGPVFGINHDRLAAARAFVGRSHLTVRKKKDQGGQL
jgi:hypothetical protein